MYRFRRHQLHLDNVQVSQTLKLARAESRTSFTSSGTREQSRPLRLASSNLFGSGLASLVCFVIFDRNDACINGTMLDEIHVSTYSRNAPFCSTYSTSSDARTWSSAAPRRTAAYPFRMLLYWLVTSEYVSASRAVARFCRLSKCESVLAPALRTLVHEWGTLAKQGGAQVNDGHIHNVRVGPDWSRTLLDGMSGWSSKDREHQREGSEGDGE